MSLFICGRLRIERRARSEIIINRGGVSQVFFLPAFHSLKPRRLGLPSALFAPLFSNFSFFFFLGSQFSVLTPLQRQYAAVVNYQCPDVIKRLSDMANSCLSSATCKALVRLSPCGRSFILGSLFNTDAMKSFRTTNFRNQQQYVQSEIHSDIITIISSSSNSSRLTPSAGPKTFQSLSTNPILFLPIHLFTPKN